ncbi:hypothetical protein FRB94_012639 [Tulasnella sp. JGI-2019a]|nr:hypothetical protein FRB94_012639 [Tulasnella sp. JGI-2019a]
MEECERLVQTWIATKRDEEISGLVAGISSNERTLLRIIKTLGPYLISETGSQREDGVTLLSAVIELCPPAKINRQSTRVLVTFYIERLDDSETIIPSLKGLLSMAQLPTFTATECTEVFHALVANVKMKAQVQSTRYIVFKTLDILFARFRDALKGLGTATVKGYLILAEGEKDPRNLMLAFSIVRVLLIEFNVADHIDDLFDITFCYFPITFKPPPNDPYGITTEDLKEALRSCLSATPFFGPLAIPLFLEKLAASTPHVKRDTLQTLSVCLPIYGPAASRRFATTLWEALKVEILQPIDAETENRALGTTQALIRTIYDGSPDAPEDLVKDICKECVEILKEPEKNQAQHAVKILSALVMTTTTVRLFALKNAVSHLLRLSVQPDEAANRRQILQHLTGLVTATEVHFSTSGVSYADEKSLEEFKDQLLGAFSSGLKSSETRVPALNGLQHMVQIPYLLSTDEVQYIVHQIDELLGPSPDLEDTRGSALNVLAVISKSTPKLIEEITLRSMFSALPDIAPSRDAKVERAAYQSVLKSLLALCSHVDLFETFVIRLFTKLELVCSGVVTIGDTSPTNELEVVAECNAAYAHAILVTIDQVLQKKTSEEHTDLPKYTDRIIARIFALSVDAANRPDSGASIAIHPRLLKVSASILSTLTRCLTAERQAQLLTRLVSSFQSGDFSTITHGAPVPSGSCPGSPLEVCSGVMCGPSLLNRPLTSQPSASATQRSLTVLFAGSAIAIHRNVQIPVPDASLWLQGMVQWTLDLASSELQAEAGMNIIAAVLNKHTDNLVGFMSAGFPAVWAAITSTDRSIDGRRKAVQLWEWMTRALLVRKHPLADEKVDCLFELLDDQIIAWDVAKVIGRLSSDDRVLTKANYAIIKLLYAQRYANRMLLRIIRDCKETKDSPRHAAYLVALASLVQNISQQLYSQSISELMPLFILGLSIPDVDIRISVINTLFMVAKDDSTKRTALAEHAITLVTTLLHNVFPGEMTSTKLRVSALQCLGVLPNAVSYDVLHPHKPTVLRELGKALDDPKREVRRMAVDTRTIWFAIAG